MSNTRHGSEGGEFRQERYASSREHERGLMANLVAKRCSVLENAEDRDLIWFMQLLSHQPGGIKKITADLIARFPECIASDSMRKFGARPGQVYSAEQVKLVREEVPNRYFPLKGEAGIDDCSMEALLEITAARTAQLKAKAKLYPANYPALEFVKCCQEGQPLDLKNIF